MSKMESTSLTIDRIHLPNQGILELHIQQLADWEADPLLFKNLRDKIKEAREYLTSEAFGQDYPDTQGTIVVEAIFSPPPELLRILSKEKVEIRLRSAIQEAAPPISINNISSNSAPLSIGAPPRTNTLAYDSFIDADGNAKPPATTLELSSPLEQHTETNGNLEKDTPSPLPSLLENAQSGIIQDEASVDLSNPLPDPNYPELPPPPSLLTASSPALDTAEASDSLPPPPEISVDELPPSQEATAEAKEQEPFYEDTQKANPEELPPPPMISGPSSPSLEAAGTTEDTSQDEEKPPLFQEETDTLMQANLAGESAASILDAPDTIGMMNPLSPEQQALFNQAGAALLGADEASSEETPLAGSGNLDDFLSGLSDALSTPSDPSEDENAEEESSPDFQDPFAFLAKKQEEQAETSQAESVDSEELERTEPIAQEAPKLSLSASVPSPIKQTMQFGASLNLDEEITTPTSIPSDFDDDEDEGATVNQISLADLSPASAALQEKGEVTGEPTQIGPPPSAPEDAMAEKTDLIQAPSEQELSYLQGEAPGEPTQIGPPPTVPTPVRSSSGSPRPQASSTPQMVFTSKGVPNEEKMEVPTIDRIQGPTNQYMELYIMQMKDWESDPMVVKKLRDRIKSYKNYIASDVFKKHYQTSGGRVIVEVRHTPPPEIMRILMKEKVEVQCLSPEKGQSILYKPELDNPIPAKEPKKIDSNIPISAPPGEGALGSMNQPNKGPIGTESMQTMSSPPAPSNPPLSVPDPLDEYDDDMDAGEFAGQQMSTPPGIFIAVGLFVLSVFGVIYGLTATSTGPAPPTVERQPSSVSAKTLPETSNAKVQITPVPDSFVWIPIQSHDSDKVKYHVLFAAKENRKLLIFAHYEQSGVVSNLKSLASKENPGQTSTVPVWSKDLSTNSPDKRTYQGALEKLQKREGGPLELLIGDEYQDVNRIPGYKGPRYPNDSMVLIVGKVAKPESEGNTFVLFSSIFMALVAGFIFFFIKQQQNANQFNDI